MVATIVPVEPEPPAPIAPGEDGCFSLPTMTSALHAARHDASTTTAESGVAIFNMSGRDDRLREKWIVAIPTALAVTFASAGVARADDRPIADAIELAPSRCLDRAHLARQIAMWLGRDRIDSRLAIAVNDEPDGVRFVVKRDGAVLGERMLGVMRVPCEEIHAATGLGIASAIDATIVASLAALPPEAPTAEAPASSVVDQPFPITPPPVVHPPANPPLDTQSPSPRLPSPHPHAPYPRFTMSVAGTVLIDVLPKVTLGIAPAAELSVVKGLDLRLSMLATGTVTVSVGPGSADVGLLAGRFDACGVLKLGKEIAEVRGCGGVIAGAVNAKGAGFDDPRTQVGPWVGPVVAADARWFLTKQFGVFTGIDGFFPGLKPELKVVGPTGALIDARAFPLAGVGISLGPSVTF